MTDYFVNTRSAIDKYNEIINHIQTSSHETTDEDDEYIYNYHLYLAHALLMDYGPQGTSRSELRQIAKIILDVLGDE